MQLTLSFFPVLISIEFARGLNQDGYPWENFKNKHGDVIDRHKLLGLYALMCPIIAPCGPTNYYGYDYRAPNDYQYKSCPPCFCSDVCVTLDACCPDLPVAYMTHECIDTILYRSPYSQTQTPEFFEVHKNRPNPELDDPVSAVNIAQGVLLTENPWNLMVSSCPANSSDEDVMICSAGNTVPVSGMKSRFSYRNRHCATCNYDDKDMVDWKVMFMCLEEMEETSPGDQDFMFNMEVGNVQTSKSEAAITVRSKTVSCSTQHKVNECVVKYDPLTSDNYPPPYPCNYEKWYRYKVGRCNVTGLWAEYDPDIDWACQNLHLTYKWRFKNVFCYICNPSISSSKSELLYDRCNVTGLWTKKQKALDADVENACLTYPRIERLSPFKNVYCIICNGFKRINKIDMFVEHGFKNIDELYLTESRSAPPVNIFLKMEGSNIVEKSKGALNLIHPKFDSFEYEIMHEEEVGDATNVSAHVDAYIRACGYQELCKAESASPKVHDKSNDYERNVYCKTCSCESTCAALEECCVDKLFEDNPYTCIKDPRILTKHISNVDFISEIGTSMTVIHKCLNRSDAELVERCEIDHHNRSDILEYIPVYEEAVYKNIYCLMCNTLKPEPLFKISIICQHYLETALIKRLSHLLELVLEHCKVQVIPNSLDTHCGTADMAQNNSDLISVCNKTGMWNNYDENIVAGCETSGSAPANFLPIFTSNIDGFRNYRNYFCFLCNPSSSISTVELLYDRCNLTGRWDSEYAYVEQSCLQTEQIEAWLPYKNVYCYLCNEGRYKPDSTKEILTQHTPPDQNTRLDPDLGYTYRMLFSLSPEEWQNVYPTGKDPNAICASGYMYDYSTRACRVVLCSEDRVLIGDTCTPISTLIPTGSDEIHFTVNFELATFPYIIFSPNYNKNIYTDFRNHIGYVTLRYLCDRFVAEVQLAVKSKGYNAICSVCQIMVVDKNCSAARNDWDGVDSVSPYIDVSRETILFNLTLTYYQNTKTKMITQSLKYHFRKPQYYFTEYFTEFHYSFSLETKPHDFRDVRHTKKFCDSETIYPLPLQDHPIFQELGSTVAGTPSAEPKIVSCSQIQLGEGEFVFDSTTNTVTIRNGTKVLSEGEFMLIDDNAVRVCLSDYTVEPEKSSQQLSAISRAHNVFSYVFTLLSLLCLLLTFTTYCIFSELRTVPGKNIMSLCASLFVAQGSLQFSSFIFTDEVICVPFAILTHYSWLATFCAMNVCSFHMYRLFYSRMMSSPEALRSFEHNKYYLLYTYTLPLAVVVLTLVSHLGASKGEFTGYGKFTCFLSDIYTTVFTFLVPATVIFVTNFAFFAITFHAIRTSPRMGSASKDRREFFMYLKLCTLTGIAWPLQLIDGLLPLTAFSFIAVFMNALQGLYIFFSYVCNRRVLKLFATLWAGQSDSLVDKKTFKSRTSAYASSSTKAVTLQT